MPKFICRTEVYFQQNVGGNGKTHENKTWASLWDNLGHLKAIAKGPTKVQEEGGRTRPKLEAFRQSLSTLCHLPQQGLGCCQRDCLRKPRRGNKWGEREYLELIFHFCSEEWLVKDNTYIFSITFYINSYKIIMQLTQVQWKLYRYLIYPVVSHSLTTKTSPN